MLDFVIYEDNENFMKKNIDCIHQVLTNCDVDYKIHKFKQYSSKIDTIIKDKSMRKIYILDVEINGTSDDVSGIELAAKIREYDWDSVIIIATAFGKYQNDVFYTRLMVLDFICKYYGYESRLMDSIRTAVNITDKQRNFVFKYNHIVYRIPYDQICFIEKEPIIKRCIIHTMNNSFYIVGTINGIFEKLSGNFCKTHQSCIVNTDNIKKIDLSGNRLFFKNDENTDLLTEKMKKEVKKYVGIS